MGRMRRLVHALVLPILAGLVLAAPAAAKLPVLQPSTYPGTTTFNCRTDAITLQPGQNLNTYTLTKACPHAEVVNGPLDASVFEAGSDAQGFMTRFKPSMVEIKPGGDLVTPAVWDLHLHHVVWLPPGGGVLASGEEKTIAIFPQGYGIALDATADWGLVEMLHNLTPDPGRQVYLTWQIDWVPQTDPARTDISPIHGTFMDVANGGAYPVFDAERAFDQDGDGEFTFPKDVSTDPAEPSNEELGKVSPARSWTVPSSYPDGVTLLSAGGHLHPGGLHVDLQVARDGPDAGTTDGDDPAEVKPLFRSDAHYYEPAGAVSWDVAMTVARPDWRVHLEPGDTVSIDATYNVRRASWYESMGILSLGWTPNADPDARDPFVDAAAVRAMYREGGALTHRRLPENVDTYAHDDLKLPDPRKLPAGGRAPAGGVDINSFLYENGGFSALRRFPEDLMSPPVIRPGGTLAFTNQDALFGQPQRQQVWHTITACRAPCNKGSGIGYPLANGSVDFDSGQLGYASGINSNVTIGSNTYATPPLKDRARRAKTRFKRGTTYTYFCRLHPFMRGSFRVRGPVDRG
jgi:plastocyanin